MEKWQEFDVYVAKEELEIKNNLLKARIIVLLNTGLVNFEDSLVKIKQELLNKFNFHYTPEEVESILEEIHLENLIEINKQIQEEEEDFFTGY